MSAGKTRDRQFMSRTMLLSALAIICFSILLALLFTRYGPIGPFLDLLGPVVTGVIEIFLLTMTFIGLVILFGNLREWYGESAGWFEVIVLFVIIVVVAITGFGPLHALLTGLLCIGVVYYIHSAQD